MRFKSIIRPLLLIIFSALLVMMFVGSPRSGGTITANAQTGWNLVWQDNFDGAIGSPPDSTKWGYDIGGGGYGNGELEYYTNSTQNAQIVADSNAQDGKALAITAIYNTNTGLTCWYGPCTFTSARLLTKNKADWAYGKLEIRAKVPTAPGIWPAFWMLGNKIGTTDQYGNALGWPLTGEIDIMEQIGLHPNINYGSLHGPGYSGGGNIGAPYTLPSGQFADAYHTFGIEWEPSVIRWYVDGILYETRTPADLPTPAGPYWWVYNYNFFALLNLAVGNTANWPGLVDTTKYPQTMMVDYVHVWQKTEPTVTPYPTNPSTPFTGTPYTLPGQIEAENYDLGGEMVAYKDWDPGNNGGVYRTDDVDVQATTDTGGGYNVAYFIPGDWMKYTVNTQTTGNYRLDLRVANQGIGGNFHMEEDGVNITGNITIPDTTGWQVWTTLSKSGVHLNAGRHVLKFMNDSGNGNVGNGNLNWFSFTLESAGPTSTNTPVTPNAPTATNTQVATTTGGCGTTNVALNKTATSSSNEAVGTTPNLAVDGNTSTRWSSGFSDPQWIQVDLGSTQSICHVTLNWEAAYGKSYQIQVSNDATNWTTIYSTTTGAGGINDLTGLSGSGRFIRMYGTVRGTAYGYSLWEFSVYAGSSATAVPTNTATRTPTNPPTNTATFVPATSTTVPTVATSGANGSPYSGTPYPIPGTVQAENYNLGGNNVAYGNTGLTTNPGGQYRTDGVGIEVTGDTGGGYDVGWTAAGEWLKYSVNVTAAGTYGVSFRVSSPYTGTTVHLEVDGVNVTGSVTVPNTGGWQAWQTVTKTGVAFTAGQHVLRWVADSNGMNINWISIQ